MFSVVGNNSLQDRDHRDDYIKKLEDDWKQKASCKDRTELFKSIMSPEAKDRVDAGDFSIVSLSYMKCSHTKMEGIKQSAFAVIFMTDGDMKVFPYVYPDFRNSKHSEEMLLQRLDDFLRKNGTAAQRILIYTYNSPCLKRENKSVPCMFQLLHKACEWQENYQVFTDVAFTKPWGLSGPNFFNYLTFSVASSPSSVFNVYIEKCKDVPFQLNEKSLRNIFKTSKIYNTLSYVKDDDKNKLRSDIKSARETLVTLAETSSGLCQDLLDRGKRKTDSFTFLPEVHDEVCKTLLGEWNQMVEDSSMTPILKVITEEFSTAVVLLFTKQLRSTPANNFMQLRRVSQMKLFDDLTNGGAVSLCSRNFNPDVGAKMFYKKPRSRSGTDVVSLKATCPRQQ